MRDEDKRAKNAIWVLLAVSMVLLAWGATSCRTYVPVVEEHTKDSVRVELRVDTFYQVVSDSVVVKLPCSDSIEVAYVDRWHTNTIYKVRERVDTIRYEQIDSIPYIKEVAGPVVYKNNRFGNFCIVWFMLTIAYICIRLYFKMVLKK